MTTIIRKRIENGIDIITVPLNMCETQFYVQFYSLNLNDYYSAMKNEKNNLKILGK